MKEIYDQVWDVMKKIVYCQKQGDPHYVYFHIMHSLKKLTMATILFRRKFFIFFFLSKLFPHFVTQPRHLLVGFRTQSDINRTWIRILKNKNESGALYDENFSSILLRDFQWKLFPLSIFDGPQSWCFFLIQKIQSTFCTPLCLVSGSGALKSDPNPEKFENRTRILIQEKATDPDPKLCLKHLWLNFKGKEG